MSTGWIGGEASPELEKGPHQINLVDSVANLPIRLEKRHVLCATLLS